MILLNPKFLAYTFCSALGLSVSAIYATTSSFIFQVDYHFSPVKFGWVTMTIGLTAISAKFLNARLSANLGVLETLKSGFALVLISGAAMLVLALCHSLPALLLLIIILLAVIGQNLIGTNATSGALSPYKHIAGSAGALFASSQMLIVFIASSLIASLAIFGVAVLAMAYVIIGLLGLIVFIYLTHDCRRMRGVERNRA
jgi:MFS family permease